MTLISVRMGGTVYCCGSLRSAVVRCLSSPSRDGVLVYGTLEVSFACIRQLCWLHGIKASSEDVSPVEHALNGMVAQGAGAWAQRATGCCRCYAPRNVR